MNAKPPRFLNDIYRDLRDRHLLLPAVALLVALIAVPLVLRKPAEATPVPPVATPTAASTAVTSAVLVDDTVDVREYQKRLAKLKSKNPFEQHFGVDQSDDASGGGGGGDATTDTTGVPSGGGGTSLEDAIAADTTSDVSSGTPTDTTNPDTGTPDTTTPDTDTDETTQPEIRFFAGRVDVTVGPIGKGKDIDNVKYLTFLPDDASPIAAFVGLTGSGRSEEAVFAISSLAEVGEGDGTCAPHKPDPCQFLSLKPGESRYIKFNGKSYRLKVRDTHVVRIKDPRDQSAGGDDAVTDGTNDEGEDGNGRTDAIVPHG